MLCGHSPTYTRVQNSEKETFSMVEVRALSTCHCFMYKCMEFTVVWCFDVTCTGLSDSYMYYAPVPAASTPSHFSSPFSSFCPAASPWLFPSPHVPLHVLPPLFREIKILKKLCHRNVISLIETFEDPEKMKLYPHHMFIYTCPGWFTVLSALEIRVCTMYMYNWMCMYMYMYRCMCMMYMYMYMCRVSLGVGTTMSRWNRGVWVVSPRKWNVGSHFKWVVGNYNWFW